MEKFNTEHFRQFTQDLNQVFYYVGLEIFEMRPQGRDYLIVFTENDFRLSLSLEVPDGIDGDFGRGKAESIAYYLIEHLEIELHKKTSNGSFIDLLESKEYPPQRFVRDMFNIYVEYINHELHSRSL